MMYPFSSQHDPDRTMALQKYLLLHYQHDALHERLERRSRAGSRHSEAAVTSAMPAPVPSHSTSSSTSSHSRKQSISSISSLTSTSGSATSLSTTSPPRLRRSSVSGSGSPQPHSPSRRRSSLQTIADTDSSAALKDEYERDDDDDTTAKHEAEELRIVNLRIKGTLTSLLNCDSVKSDRACRMWVQTRLMDAERELKCERLRMCEDRAVGVQAMLCGCRD